MSQQKAILLLGSNIGDQNKNIDLAINQIENKIGPIYNRSKKIMSEPVEFASCNIFCNIALSISTSLSPLQLLKELKEIERNMGRIKDSRVFGEYADRIIDIDIVEYNKLFFESNILTIPHKKHMEERQFSRELLLDLELSEKHRI